MPAAASHSLQSRYDAAFLTCMDARQAPFTLGGSTTFVPAPPSLIPPALTAPAFVFPPILPPTPEGGQSTPLSIAPTFGSAFGPG